MRALKAQLESVHEEMKYAPLVDKGLIARPRYLQLDRAACGLEGQSADAMANIAKAASNCRAAAADGATRQ